MRWSRRESGCRKPKSLRNCIESIPNLRNGGRKRSCSMDWFELQKYPAIRDVFYSHNGMTGSDSQACIMLRIGRPRVQSHTRKEPVDEENKVCGVGCPCRDNFSSRGGAGRGD